MGKVLVLYDSASGNAAKMAMLVVEGAESVAGMEVRLRYVEQVTPEDVPWCDGLALGSPTNMGLMSWKMKRFWDEPMAPYWMKVDGKIACVFSSAGGWGGGTELACQSLLTVLINFGFLVFGLTDYAGKLTTAHYGAITVREPREQPTSADRLRSSLPIINDLGQRINSPLPFPPPRPYTVKRLPLCRTGLPPNYPRSITPFLLPYSPSLTSYSTLFCD